MITQYIESQFKKASYKILEDGTYFGEIPGLKGVWADGKTLEICRQGLQEVLEEWILLKLTDGDSIPGLTPSVKTKRVLTKQYA
ncbi:MAG: type II toxin-antitoxin system HicB family antitoxin [Candidatus Nealsonbacteria bacterium DGGOD1a]|jgi:predicted RNase H-like HicB family nuclease|nr:MAG: type II toxin-antitoxin system HicB family antitoxin [Candidatus Nealsonbacteria bacterium DGGOD1a]